MSRRAGHGDNWGVEQLTRRDAGSYARLASAVLAILALTACGDERPAVGTPLIADIEAAAETKPPPTAAILSDPNADARYNAEIEAWGDRVSAAGRRLCRFYRDVGVKVECGG